MINDQGTFYIVQNNQLLGITNPGILNSYGLSFKDASVPTTQDMSLPKSSSNLSPDNGSLVKTKDDPTVYLISNGQKYGFASAKVFTSLGFKFSSVLTVTSPELNNLSLAPTVINTTNQGHNPGVDINVNGTIYWVGPDNLRHPYPSLAVYNSWHIDNDFSAVVKANSADLTLPLGSEVGERVMGK